MKRSADTFGIDTIRLLSVAFGNVTSSESAVPASETCHPCAARNACSNATPLLVVTNTARDSHSRAPFRHTVDQGTELALPPESPPGL